MFIYENGNSLNLTLTGNKPVETPDVVIKGYQEGASVIVGSTVYGVKQGTEYPTKASTLVYQKDGKLAITFRGIKGMNDPEVIIDEIGGCYSLVVSGEELKLNIVDNTVVPVAEEAPAPMTRRTSKKSEPEVVEEPKQEETEVVSE